MAKPIHTMVRVLDLERSIAFYAEAFGFAPVDRYDFPNFTLVYLRTPENEVELELTLNRGRTQPYSHGDAYGHLALSVDDLAATHVRLVSLGLHPAPVKELQHDGKLLARFFFIEDPDGYKIEVLQRQGRYL
jgi:lactoylglutathione lyase